MSHRARLALLALTASLFAPPTTGCGGADDSFGLIGGEKVDASQIDRDPVALLPSGIILLGYADLAAMFQSKWGADAAQIVTNLLPLGAESNFSPQRDATRIFGGMYAMQGADFCAVVQGNFDADAIRKAADARSITISGAPLVKSRYADNDLYTAGNLGFVVVTGHTVITGNETGIRRALDRLRRGKLERSVPQWMVDLLNTKNASMIVAGDLSTQSVTDAASAKLPFLGSLRAVRILGNFQPPGMNFAGSLTYPDAATAQAGAQNLQQIQQLTALVSLFSSFGFGAPLPTPQIAQQQSDVGFTVQVDDNLVKVLLQQAGSITKSAVTSTKVPHG
ncbi:MAG: hypothetical protein U0359_30635 [Byssovorax sp.]